jgi:hypothetical protein
MSLEGTWIITNRWHEAPAYKFRADFSADGTITVPGGFFGTWTRLGTSSQVSLAIAKFNEPASITCYNGNVLGRLMGGEMTGARRDGKGIQGEWHATHVLLADVEESELREPGV